MSIADNAMDSDMDFKQKTDILDFVVFFALSFVHIVTITYIVDSGLIHCETCQCDEIKWENMIEN